MTTITLEKTGRRTYLVGNTFPLRATLRDAGAHWDAERKAWWFGDTKKAAEIVASHTPAAETPTAASKPEAPGEDAVVAGKATYKGKKYYLAGRIVRGRTHWDDTVESIGTRDGQKVLLYSLDGNLKFWAQVDRGGAPAEAAAKIDKLYSKPQTIGGLRAFAAEAKAGFPGRATCGTCGSPFCDGAKGWLCQED